jgi:NedA-like, galactose-binding domain
MQTLWICIMTEKTLNEVLDIYSDRREKGKIKERRGIVISINGNIAQVKIGGSNRLQEAIVSSGTEVEAGNLCQLIRSDSTGRIKWIVSEVLERSFDSSFSKLDARTFSELFPPSNLRALNAVAGAISCAWDAPVVYPVTFEVQESSDATEANANTILYTRGSIAVFTGAATSVRVRSIAENGQKSGWSSWLALSPVTTVSGGGTSIDVVVTAGEALSERDYVFLDESDDEWYKVDTNSVPVKCGRIRGVVNEAGGITISTTGSVRLLGEVGGYTGLTAWKHVYASTTAGTMQQGRPGPVSGSTQKAIIEIGIAISTTKIIILPPKPVQYMKRENALANNSTILIEHHKDNKGYGREAKAYIGSNDVGVTLEEYLSSNQDTQVALEDRAPATYSDQLSGGTASASTGTASLANDDDTGTIWGTSAGVQTGWWKYDFGSGITKIISKYTITANTADRDPQDWTFEGSNDDSNWDVLDTKTSEVFSSGQKRTFDISNGTAYRYYRFDITSSSGGNIQVDEFEMLGVATWNNGAQKLSQSFTLASAQNIGSVSLYLRKVGIPTGTTLSVRIETDSAGDPSGTLAHANATQTMLESDLSTNFADVLFTFTTFNLASGTYHIVVSTDRATSETDYIEWGADGSSPSYTGGEMKSFDGATWSSETKDAIFSVFSISVVFVEAAIVGRWSGGTRDIAVRYDNGSGSSASSKTTFKNVLGFTADVTVVLEIP